MSMMVSSDKEPRALATTRSRESAPMALKRQIAMLCTRKSNSQYTKNLQGQPGQIFELVDLLQVLMPRFPIPHGVTLQCGTVSNGVLSVHREPEQHNAGMSCEAFKGMTDLSVELHEVKAMPTTQQDACQALAISVHELTDNLKSVQQGWHRCDFICFV